MGRAEINAEQEMQPQHNQPQQQFPPQPQAYPPQPQQYPPPQAQQPVQYPPSPAFNNAGGPNHQQYAPAPYPPPSPEPDPVKPVQFPPMPQPAPVQFPPSTPPHVMGPNGYALHQQPMQYPQPAAKHNVAQGVPLPGGPQLPLGLNENWRTGLFDCMEDPSNAVITCVFPCFTFGQIAEILDSGNTSCATSGLIYGVILALIYAPCLISCSYRSRLRSKFNLPEAPAPDWITHCVFEYCALCQEYRELQKRGIDPSIGWHANVARNPGLLQQQPQVMMTPPMNQRMMG